MEIPKFNSIEEESDWWASIDTSQLSGFKEAGVDFSEAKLMKKAIKEPAPPKPDDKGCTCGSLEEQSTLWSKIFKEPIKFVNVECPVHGNERKKEE